MRKRGVVALSVVMTICVFTLLYESFDPMEVAGQSCNCAPLPTTEEPTNEGDFAQNPTTTLFAMLISSYQNPTTNWAGYNVGESTPDPNPDDDSCWANDPNSPYSSFDAVTTPQPTYYWNVGQVGYWNGSPGALNTENAYYSENWWGYDGVGYGQDMVNRYRQDLQGLESGLPCGTAFEQIISMMCPYTSSWSGFVTNSLSATIYTNSVKNCHDDTYGDYEACETEYH